MNHEQILTEWERQLKAEEIVFRRELVALRASLVEKYGEEAMARKDQQLLELWEQEIEEGKGAV